ncbi:MAG TPA: MAPEG family protein [Aestuariivirgaceae bacterium]|jgi:hypothetical protein
MTIDKMLLLPALLHVALIFLLVFLTGSGRVAAARRGEVRLGDVALDNSKWPENLRKRANNYQNQFELPVLFYMLIALLLSTRLADAVQVVLAWVFVLSRLVHSYIHTGRNLVIDRFYAFTASVITLLAMWIWFALRLFLQ